MTLSDSIFDSINKLLNGVQSYNDYSDEYRKDIIATLAIMYHTLFKIQGAGVPSVRKTDIPFCRRYATKNFNCYLYSFSDDDYQHCDDCMCNLCVNMTPTLKAPTHDGCKGLNCMVVDRIEKIRMNNRRFYHEHKDEIQKRRKERKQSGIKGTRGRPPAKVSRDSVD